MQNYETELIDLVDKHDHVVKTCFRSTFNDHPNLFMRIVLCFIADQQGRLCIMRRSSLKKKWADCWAIPGGAVQSGETYGQAVEREVIEEINVIMPHFQNRFLGQVQPMDIHDSYMRMVYEIKINHIEITLNTDDFSEYRWLTPAQIVELEMKDQLCPDLIYLVKKFYVS